jgi:ribose/xylose/arabinose/galactoside ABC-type transport system permease subunit
MPRSVNKVAGILLLLVLICVGTTLLAPAFVEPYNVQNIVRYSAQYGIIGIGVAFVIITGGIDLSIGSVIGLVGCLLPMLLVQKGWSISMSLAAVLGISLAIGLVHGLLITKMRLQPFIVTLCGLLIYRGLARWITADQTMGFGSRYDDSLRLLAIGKPCSVAFLILLAGVGLAIWSAWRWWRATDTVGRIADPSHQRPDTRALAIVTLGIGLLLAGIGGSRFLHGYAIERGDTEFNLGPLSIPTWGTRIADRGIEQPQELMQLAGWLVIPGIVWLVVVLISDRQGEAAFPSKGVSAAGAAAAVPPLILMGISALCVLGARRLVEWPADDFWGGPSWARTWRITAVFVSLGGLMASLAWFGQRALKIAGPRALLPLLLSSTAAILWLLGQTPLGQTLVPAPFLFLLVLAGIASVFLNQTIYGRYLLALGNNEEAARFSGIQTDRMILLAYVLCSLIAGLGGILFALDTNTIQPQSHGNFYELYAIAAAVLGGCSLRGGEGTILGVVIGAAVMRVLYNSINLIGIPSQLEFAIIGTVILLGVLADEIVKRMIARRK